MRWDACVRIASVWSRLIIKEEARRKTSECRMMYASGISREVNFRIWSNSNCVKKYIHCRRWVCQYRRRNGLDYFPSLFCLEDRQLPKLHSPMEQDIRGCARSSRSKRSRHVILPVVAQYSVAVAETSSVRRLVRIETVYVPRIRVIKNKWDRIIED